MADEGIHPHPGIVMISTDAMDEEGKPAVMVHIDGSRFMATDFKVDHANGLPQVTLTIQATNVVVKP